MVDVISGSIENGRGEAVIPSLYTGPVGIKERSDTLELAWFGRSPVLTAPVKGTLDGEPIRVTAIRSRDLSQAQPLRQRAPKDQVIIATAELVAC